MLWLAMALAAPVCDEVAPSGPLVDSPGGVLDIGTTWLFGRADLRTDLDLDPAQVEGVGRLAAALAERGVTLAALPVPPRGVVYGERFAQEEAFQGYDVQAARGAYARLVAQLRGAGLLVGDVLEAWSQHTSGKLFFHKDHHWTPFGARLAAEGLARTLSDAGALNGVPVMTFDTVQQGTATRTGSYQAKVEEGCGVELSDETWAQFETWPNSLGLLDERPSPGVVLAGTSNSRGPLDDGTVYDRFNVAGALMQALERDVMNVSVAGGGAFTALEAYLNSPSFAEEPPRVVVWEFPAQDRRLQEDVEVYRLLEGAALGGCEEPVAQGGPTPLQAGSVWFEGLGRKARGRLVVEGGPELWELTLKLVYAQGEETVSFSRSPRAPQNSGRFVLTLREDLGPLRSAHVEQGAGQPAAWSVCR